MNEDPSAIMALMEKRGELMECPRMRIKAASLPCGQREECFGGKIPCPHLPKGATMKTGREMWREAIW